MFLAVKATLCIKRRLAASLVSTLYMPKISPSQVVKNFKTSLDLPQRVKSPELRVIRRGGGGNTSKKKMEIRLTENQVSFKN